MTSQEAEHLARLCANTHLHEPRLLTGDCWRSFAASARKREPPSRALDLWIARCEEFADDCDCEFYRGEHL